MPKSYRRGPRLRRPFLVTSYLPGSAGGLAAALPAFCPRGIELRDLSCCATKIDYYRGRKTGPQHPLAMARCRTHGCGFTLYPPGFAPYQRQPLINIAPDGSEVVTEDLGLRRDFADTPFAAAIDAADGIGWARDSHDSLPEHWWSTQGRHLNLAARLVGIARGLAERAREAIAALLSVSGLRQREHLTAKGYRAMGKAVCDILSQLGAGHASRAFDLLLCGHIAGHWGEPCRWDVKRCDLERSPFCRRGTASDP